MRYSHFELLLLALGVALVVGGLFIGPATSPDAPEVVGQLLMLVVLVGAVHWGRNGGFVAALVATLVYVYLALVLPDTRTLSDDVLTTIAVRVIAYGVVGVVGGELCGRIKYVFARLGKDPMVDDESGVYNAQYAGRAIRSNVGRWERYQTPFSAVLVEVDPRHTGRMGGLHRRTITRRIADHIRTDIRLVDDVAHIGEGRFVVLLPHTGHDGARTLAARLLRGLAHTVSLPEAAIGMTVMSCPTDVARLCKLAHELDGGACEPAAQAEPVVTEPIEAEQPA